MDTIMQSLAGLDNFALYFGLSIVFLFIFKLVYALVTPHDEWKLVNNADIRFEELSALIAKGAALIAYETGKADFSQMFSIDEVAACDHASSLIEGKVIHPEPEGRPDLPQHSEGTSKAFIALGLADQMYPECQSITDLPHWSPASMLPKGNYRQGFAEYLVGRSKAKATPKMCSKLVKMLYKLKYKEAVAKM